MSCGQNWITAFKIKVTVKVKNVSEYLSGWYLLNHKTFCSNLLCDAAKWARLSCRGKKCLLSSRSRAQQGLMWSKYDSDYYIFWTADSSAAKLAKFRLLQVRVSCGKKWITAFKVKVTRKGQTINVYPDDIFYTAKHFVTQLDIVVHPHELECHG